MNKKHRVLFYALILLTVLAVYLTQKSKLQEYSIVITDYLDTVCEITIISDKKDILYNDCVSYIKKMDAELSANNEESALYKLNSGEDIKLSSDAESLIAFGEQFGKDNPELFSIYLNPFIKAWDIKNNTGTIPDISSVMDDVKAQKSINLGAIAKGFITDKLVERLHEENVSSALINLGGNAYAMGKKITGENWKIGIQDPKNENELIGVITAENLAVVTSGDYQRYFEKDGTRYHHILNPVTGYPANSGLHSVTVISENATLADALSTAIFVAGVEKGKELLKKYNVQGILVTGDTVYFSKSLENIFRQSTFAYKYEFIL